MKTYIKYTLITVAIMFLFLTTLPGCVTVNIGEEIKYNQKDQAKEASSDTSL